MTSYRYLCKLCGSDSRVFRTRKEAIKHIRERHDVKSDDEANNYIISEPYGEKRAEGEGERSVDIKVDESKLDAEIRAQIESTLKQLLDRQRSLEEDYRSFKEKVEKLIENIQSSPQLQPQPQAKPQVTVDVLEGEYIPIAKKVLLNPRVLMYYQYARSQGYEGDLGDFINEVIESFFRDRRIKIAVLKGVSELEWGEKQG